MLGSVRAGCSRTPPPGPPSPSWGHDDASWERGRERTLRRERVGWDWVGLREHRMSNDVRVTFRTVVGAAAFTCLLVACGRASAKGSTIPGLSCQLNRSDCANNDVIKTVAHYYALAGATSAQARCLAAISGRGQSKVIKGLSFATPQAEQLGEHCVESGARLRFLIARAAHFLLCDLGRPVLAQPRGGSVAHQKALESYLRLCSDALAKTVPTTSTP
jgi:hypothetical protein